MINDSAEKCLGCTIKHLSEALVVLDKQDIDPIIGHAYFCGNLGHAANHVIHYSADLADRIRTLRLDSINNDLTLAMSKEEIVEKLTSIIKDVSDYKEELAKQPVQAAATKTPVTANTAQNRPLNLSTSSIMVKGGCRCRKAQQ